MKRIFTYCPVSAAGVSRQEVSMGKKWVYLFDELDQVNAYVGGAWDAVRGLLG